MRPDVTSHGRFKHPGLLHSQADLDRMKRKVAEKAEPWYSGWLVLANNNRIAQLDWVPQPFESVSRGPGMDIHNQELKEDSAAAYFHALEWYITGDRRHAEKSREILIAWASTMKELVGRDQVLGAGIYGYQLCNAAEILRYTYDGWSSDDTELFKGMMMGIFYPIIENFKPTANGNWDAACIVTMMSIGVFCDDRDVFNRAVDYYYNGIGKGSITHYVYESGQCQESTRDQQHTQLGLALLASACEVGYQQGLDMFGAYDNRLLKGFEYTAKYNLGYDLPCDGTISPIGRGLFRPVFEHILSHYLYRAGVSESDVRYTKQVVEKIRPEGWCIDHESYGTLLYALDSASASGPTGASASALANAAVSAPTSASASSSASAPTSAPKPSPAVILKSLAVEAFVSLGGRDGAALLAGAPDTGSLPGGENAAGCEIFEIVILERGRFAFRSKANGKYVSVGEGEGAPLAADRDAVGIRETFQWLDYWGGVRGYLRAEANGKFVVVDADTRGISATGDHPGRAGLFWAYYQ